MNTAEQFAETYFRERGFQPERFAEVRGTNTPDFRVLQGDELLLYCDARHVQHDEWREKRLPTRKPRKTVSLVPTPLFQCLSGHIREAAQRFDAINPCHSYANVLMLVNSDRNRGVADLRSVLIRNFFRPDALVEQKYTGRSDAEIRDGKPTIDLYLWRDDWKPPEEVSGCLWRDPERREVLVKLLPGERLWEEPSSPREVDPKLRDFIKRVIAPCLVNRYLKQIRQRPASVQARETPQTIGGSHRNKPPKTTSE